MSAGNKQGTRAVIGFVAFLMAGVLLYFSSSPAITCTRADSRVDCEVTAKMLNLYVVDSPRVTGVREVLMVSSATSGSRTPPHLKFRTDAGDVDLGYFSQRFASSWSTLNAFVQESTDPVLTMDTGVTFQDMTAYAAVLFLLLCGVLMIASMFVAQTGRSVYDQPS